MIWTTDLLWRRLFVARLEVEWVTMLLRERYFLFYMLETCTTLFLEFD